MSLYNLRNPAVKRLMKEAEELKSPTDEYHAQPLEDNLFEWHFTLKGPSNTDYDGGIYHGRITLPPDYPMKPPSIILLTPNGRFETNKKICLSISGHHPETWQPSWSIRTALLAIIGFMPTPGNGAIGSLDYTREEREQLALKSQEWKCPECGFIKDIFSKPTSDSSNHDLESTLSNTEIDCNKVLNHSPILNDNINNTLQKDCSASSDTSKPYPDDSSSSLHQRKGVIQKSKTDEHTVANLNSTSNIFYTTCMWVIVIIIALLCLRRLFSL